MEYGPMDWIRVPGLNDYPDYKELNYCLNRSVEDYF
jgi:hypothetical protein